MGVRFRRSKKILPGVRLNINKGSMGLTFGGKWFKYTINTKGRRATTVGLPGTGLSYTTNTTGTPDVKRELPRKLTPEEEQAQQQEKSVEIERELEESKEKYNDALRDVASISDKDFKQRKVACVLYAFFFLVSCGINFFAPGIFPKILMFVFGAITVGCIINIMQISKGRKLDNLENEL